MATANPFITAPAKQLKNLPDLLEFH